jgi:hypothetical protein
VCYEVLSVVFSVICSVLSFARFIQPGLLTYPSSSPHLKKAQFMLEARRKRRKRSKFAIPLPALPGEVLPRGAKPEQNWSKILLVSSRVLTLVE